MEQRDRHRQRGREPDDDRPVRRRRRFVGEIGDGRDNQEEEDAVAGRNARPAGSIHLARARNASPRIGNGPSPYDLIERP